jgi:hypothetical protein
VHSAQHSEALLQGDAVVCASVRPYVFGGFVWTCFDGRGASHLSPSPVRTHRARLRQWAQDKIIHVPIEKVIANGRPVRRGADATVQTVQTIPS